MAGKNERHYSIIQRKARRFALPCRAVCVFRLSNYLENHSYVFTRQGKPLLREDIIISFSFGAVARLTWHAEQIRVAHEVRIAHAFVRQGIAHGTDAANHPLASSLATAADAHAWLGAWDFRRANIRSAPSTGEGIAHETLDALAGRSVVTDDTLCASAADKAVTFCIIIGKPRVMRAREIESLVDYAIRRSSKID